MLNPTKENYGDFNKAYDFFNRRLFKGELPRCLITMQRKKNAYGYFSGDRWARADSDQVTDEIALNPTHFQNRETTKVLSTLVHEMAHLWQHHHGAPSRNGYHNKEWATKMEAVGLIPSDTGAPDGKQTGQKVTHYIEEGGAFFRACASLVDGGFAIPYLDRAGDGGARKKKAASKTKYTCDGCGLNVWAKPDANIVCGDCELTMLSDEN